MKYGFDKIKATVSKKGTLTFNNRTFYVAVGAQNFSRHKSSIVHISDLGDKLLIFEYKKDGILLGEALCRQPFAKPPKQQPTLEANAVELILAYLESQKMVVDRLALIKVHHQGLTLEVAKTIYKQNQRRYNAYSTKLRQPEKITGKALFNAFILDCQRHLSKNPVVHYASSHQR
jgi:hypothetical protein